MAEAEAAKSTTMRLLQMDQAPRNLGVMRTVGPIRFMNFLAESRPRETSVAGSRISPTHSVRDLLGVASGVRSPRHFMLQTCSINRYAGEFDTQTLPPARQPRSERPKLHIQPRSHALVTVSRHHGEHYSLSHALRHALQFSFDISDNETQESSRID